MPFSTTDDLAKAKGELKRLGASATSNSREMLTFLRCLRELGVSDCEGVLEYGSALLARFPRQMSAEERTTPYHNTQNSCIEGPDHDPRTRSALPAVAQLELMWYRLAAA
jgi:hypothetical protein